MDPCLKRHFGDARKCKPSTSSSLRRRSVGFEVETLFVDATTGRPITRETSQSIFMRLVTHHGWKIEETKSGLLVHISYTNSIDGVCEYTYRLIYELGWNNIELITPAWFSDHAEDVGISQLEGRLGELYDAAMQYNAKPLERAYDGFENDDTLMMPDKRDEVWKELDGPVLCVLGHIASVHYNIDLCSIGEGMKWIRKIAKLRKRHGWPDTEVARIWQRYLAESHAGYEHDRYGTTPARNFEQYCDKLADYRVNMGHIDSHDPKPQRIPRPLPFRETHWVSEELFLRSVWWGARLRVRCGQLVLEIRDVPRGPDSEILENLKLLRRELGF